MIKNKIKDYFRLTKPSILLLVLLTGATALIVHGGYSDNFLAFGLVMLGLFLVGGCANGLNQYFERFVDAEMFRTRKKRPLADKRLKTKNALYFIFFSGILGIGLFLYLFNLLSALLSFFTIIFYSIYYTLYLKPRTPQNIVIGGASGAMAPLISWAAIQGDLYSIAPWTIFLIVFFWTPPHFWALALYSKEDYKRVNYPMMPLVKGEEYTYKVMVSYSVLMVFASYAILLYNPAGFLDTPPISFLYTIISTFLGVYFLYKVYFSMKKKTELSQRSLFSYSILYIFLICFSMILDRSFF